MRPEDRQVDWFADSKIIGDENGATHELEVLQPLLWPANLLCSGSQHGEGPKNIRFAPAKSLVCARQVLGNQQSVDL